MGVINETDFKNPNYKIYVMLMYSTVLKGIFWAYVSKYYHNKSKGKSIEFNPFTSLTRRLSLYRRVSYRGSSEYLNQ